MSLKLVALAILFAAGLARATEGSYGTQVEALPTKGLYGEPAPAAYGGGGYGGWDGSYPTQGTAASPKAPKLVMNMEPTEFQLPASLMESNATTDVPVRLANATAASVSGAGGARVAAAALGGAAVLALLLA